MANDRLYPVYGYVQSDSTVKLLTNQIASINFDGKMERTTTVKFVSNVVVGDAIYVSEDDSLPPIIISKIEIDEIAGNDNTNGYFIYYLNDVGQEIKYLNPSSGNDYFAGTDTLTVSYEDPEVSSYGTTGWAITKSGNAIFSNVYARGEVHATTGSIDGSLTIGDPEKGPITLGTNLSLTEEPLYTYDGLKIDENNYFLSYDPNPSVSITNITAAEVQVDSFTSIVKIYLSTTGFSIGDIVELFGFTGEYAALNTTFEVDSIGSEYIQVVSTRVTAATIPYSSSNPEAQKIGASTRLQISQIVVTNSALRTVVQATITCASSHNFNPGEYITIYGLTETNLAELNDSFNVFSVPSSTQFVISDINIATGSSNPSGTPKAKKESTNNKARFKVGGPNNFMRYLSDTDALTVTGTINATYGNFTGNVNILSGGALIAGSTTDGVIINSTGLYGYEQGLEIFSIPSSSSLPPKIATFTVVNDSIYSDGAAANMIVGTRGWAGVTSTSGTIGPVTYDSTNGIYTATISGLSTTANLLIGQALSATAGTGNFGAYNRVLVRSKTANSVFVSSGYIFTAGTVTNITGVGGNNITIRGQEDTGSGIVPAIYTVINGTATTATTENGFFVGRDGTFRLANTGGSVTMSGGNLTVTGGINATSGTIGANGNYWYIGQSSYHAAQGSYERGHIQSFPLTQDDPIGGVGIEIDSGGYINILGGTYSTSPTRSPAEARGLIFSAVNSSYSFWWGNDNWTNTEINFYSPIYITRSGNLKATGANITGIITATSGRIGSWEIKSTGELLGASTTPSKLGEIALFTEQPYSYVFRGSSTPQVLNDYFTGSPSIVFTDSVGMLAGNVGAMDGGGVGLEATDGFDNWIDVYSLNNGGIDINTSDTLYLSAGPEIQIYSSTNTIWGNGGNAFRVLDFNDRPMIKVDLGTQVLRLNNTTRNTYTLEVLGSIGYSGGIHDTSSRLFKKDIRPYSVPETVLNISPVLFKYDEDKIGVAKAELGKDIIGFIAEDFIEHGAPEFVTFDEDGVTVRGLDYSKLVVSLFPLIKAQKEKIEELEQRLTNIGG